MSDGTITILWLGTYLVWVVAVFVLRKADLYPMIFGLILGSVVGGLVSLVVGDKTVGFLAMLVSTAFFAWYIYRPGSANNSN